MTMPRTLTFQIGKHAFSAAPRKVDRRKLYGWTEILALDDDGNPCTVVAADPTGQLLIPRGGTAVGLLDPSGEWVERSELVAVDAEGRPAQLLPSSYDAPVALKRKVSAEKFLEHDITDFYQLDGAPDGLLRSVGDAIFTFDYCYTSGCEGVPAFVLAAEGALFLLIGRRLRFEMIGYDQPGFIDDFDDDEADDAVDFAMF